MILPDVNVLVCAFREDTPRHAEFLAWVEGLVNSPQPYAMSDMVLSGFLRVVTPGLRHWSLFVGLYKSADARGNLVADAYLAALAVETRSEFVTTDRDFARFPDLRWRHPLD